MAGALTMLAPIAARTHVGLFIAVRFLTGVICGPGFPAAAALWGKWVDTTSLSQHYTYEYSYFQRFH